MVSHVGAKWTGQLLGNYRLVDLIDTGGSAEVYKGEHIHLGIHAAVKILKTVVTDDEIKAFRTEARIVASLKHPNILHVLDFDIQNGTPFLVMDYAQKGSLKDFQSSGLPLPYVVILSYIKQIANALQFAHDQQKLIHRDVKPANMLKMDDDRIVLSDFGIASIMQNSTQTPVGTVYYIAPEQIKGHPVLASDQYALGIVAYQWLSGDLPFKGTKQEICAQHLSVLPPSLVGKVPDTIEAVIQRVLSKDPQERYPRVLDFAEALENAYQQAAQQAQNQSQPIPLVISSVAGSAASPDSTTSFFTTPQIQPAASAGILIARYDELLRIFHQINIERKQVLQHIQQRFEKEREQIAADLQSKQKQAISKLARVREAVDSAERKLKQSKWKYLLSNASVRSLQAPGNLELMAQFQKDALDVSKQIGATIEKYSGRVNIYKSTMSFIGGTAAAIALLYGAYAVVAWLLHFLGVNWGFFSLTIILIFVAIVAFLLAATGALWLWDDDTTGKSIRTQYELLKQASFAVKDIDAKRNEMLENAWRGSMMDLQARLQQACQEVEQNVRKSVAQYNATIARYMKEDGLLVASWDDPRWQHWQPQRQAISLARLGDMAESASFPFLPAFTICPGGDNILFKAPGTAKTYAVQALQSLMLRLLTTQPPGKLHFTLIDPTGLGKNVATFLQLADYDEQLISGKVWTKREHIAQQLTILSEHMEYVIQQYLRNHFQTIDEYNKVAGEIAEPYRILVVVGFPAGFSAETANLLTSIAAAGSRYGVSVLMTGDIEQPLPQGFNLGELERVTRVITWDDRGGFNWEHRDIGTCGLQLERLPRPEILKSLLQSIGEEAVKARQRVEIPFRLVIEQRIIPEYRWWAKDQSTKEEILTPVGRKGATKYQYLHLGKGIAHHALIVGKTGSGKTTLLHDLIVGLSLIYHPDELELYLIDFKMVGFTPYANYKLPHARVIAIQSEREFGLSVLEGLNQAMEERKRIFSKAGVQEITPFRRVQPHVRMPRILLVIDEFQDLFIRSDDIAIKAAEYLDHFAREGRGFGIHVILASQTLASLSALGRPNILDKPTIRQMAVRIALKNEEIDSRLILGEGNSSSSLLFQFRPGEAIYNADSGAEAGNNRFQSFWLSDDELSVYLEAISRLADSHRYVPAHTQIIFDGSKNADVDKNALLNGLLNSKMWLEQQHPLIWLGDPISLKETTNLQIRPRRGNNILILGKDEGVAPGLLTIAQFTLAAQHHPGNAHFYVIDGRTYTTHIERLRAREKQFPHGVRVADRYTLSSLLTEVCNEIKNRALRGPIQKPPVYLFIYGLHLIQAFRQESGADSNNAQLSTILRDGPEQGVHTLLWCDVLNNFNRSLDLSFLNEFEYRIVFQMSRSDSNTLIGSSEANELNPYRAIFFKEGAAASEKFIPYEQPSAEWLEQVVHCLHQKS